MTEIIHLPHAWMMFTSEQDALWRLRTTQGTQEVSVHGAAGAAEGGAAGTDSTRIDRHVGERIRT